ncbi:MAG: threonylcarbamoyl-AMP synthase [Bacteroidales bacterium]|nr:threonylcarbamoyl-AMP synthase [Bacteroidales bacterium]
MHLKDSIQKAAQYIREGKVVAFPTETVYGLGANALDPFAVAKIFELKERPSFDPLIVHIAALSELDALIAEKDERIYALAEKFWPGPLTLVLPKSKLVPDLVTSGMATVGIRMPAHPVALELIAAAQCPLAAPSANKFGRISPTTAAHVRKQLPEVDYILDGGKTTVGIESTIIRLTYKGFQLLRSGVITQEEIASILPFDSSGVMEKSLAPGMLKSHYSPRKRMLIADEKLLETTDLSHAGLISFTGKHTAPFKRVIEVSERNDLRDYAVNLFAAMHSLEDDPEIDLIIAEAVAETGIGKAIMDRLKKAEYDWRRMGL